MRHTLINYKRVHIISFAILLACPAMVSGQSEAISLSSGTAAPGANVLLPISLTSSGGASPTALQYTLAYAPADFSAVSVSVAGTASAAGKTADCAALSAGQYQCLLYGLNSTAIADGLVAIATLTVSSSTVHSSSVVNLLSTLSSSDAGDTIAVTGLPGTVNISQTGMTVLKGIICSPATLQAPGSAACVVTLSGPAPAGGFSASIGYSGQSGAQITAPASIVVAAGAAMASFPLQVGAVQAAATITVTASQGSVSVSFPLSISPVSQLTISGTITPASLGSGANIRLSGSGSATAAADASGNYKFTGLTDGSYSVTPLKPGTVFSPATQTVTLAGRNAASLNFTAAPAPARTLSGKVLPASAGVGTVIQLSGAQTGIASADSSGNYSFSGLANGVYSVSPSKAGFAFTPASQSVTINGASVSSVDFSVSKSVGVPSGIVTDAQVSTDRGVANSSVVSPSFSTTARNELLLAFISADKLKDPNTTVTSVSGAGAAWELVVRANVQSGTSEIWRSFAPAPLNAVTVTVNLSESVVSSLTVMSFKGVAPLGAAGSGAIGAIAIANGRPGAPAASLVTTRNDSLIVGVGNDYDNAIGRTVGPNQKLIHQFLAPVGDAYWVQSQNGATPLSGTRVTINDTAPAEDRYNLAICEILAAP